MPELNSAVATEVAPETTTAVAEKTPAAKAVKARQNGAKGGGVNAKKATAKAASNGKAPAKGKAAPTKASPKGKAEANGATKRQPSPFLSGADKPLPWTAASKSLVKALAGTKGGAGLTVAQIAKASKLEEKVIIHYTYHGVKGEIIAVEKLEGEKDRRFYLTATGRKINTDKVNV